jgi:diguanylate cyclase (GGDEF)-like protein
VSRRLPGGRELPRRGAATAFRRPRARWPRALAAGLALVATLAGAGERSRWIAGSESDRLDRIERRAPLWREAEALLQPLAPEARPGPEARRAWLFTRGLIAAGLSEDAHLDAVLEALRRPGGVDQGAPARPASDAGGASAAPAPTAEAALDRAAADALEAQAALQRLQSAEATRYARAALQATAPACGLALERPETGAGRSGADCDYRIAWQALSVLGRESRRRRAPEHSVEWLRPAVALALRAGDEWRHAAALSQLARALADSGQAEAARQALEQAQRIARPLDDPALLALLRYDEMAVVSRDGFGARRRELLEEALALARTARHRPLEVAVLAYLSDYDVKTGSPARALRAIEAALPLARQRGMRRTEAVLHGNAGLAHIASGRMAEGRAAMEHALELWRALGSRLDETTVLREFGEAFLAAGDARTALAIYHRERALRHDIDQADREHALQELASRYDSELRRRRVELLRSENALKTAELGNRSLRQRVWAIGVATLALAAALAGLLYWRVREANRQLASSQVSLRRQSERDPLTGLANRRHFHALMQQRARETGILRGYEGSLLLLDIDHFKAINDRHGHAAGDAVLGEAARRLALAVREEDLLARWGGEEFLVATRRLEPAQVAALAERLLHALGDEPLVLPGGAGPLRLTASIGHASLPLPGREGASARPIGWERALKLVDAALYLAKREGRNRAVALLDLHSDEEAAMREIEGDLEAAVRDGRVSVATRLGPQDGAPAPGTAPAGSDGRLRCA